MTGGAGYGGVIGQDTIQMIEARWKNVRSGTALRHDWQWGNAMGEMARGQGRRAGQVRRMGKDQGTREEAWR